MAKLRWGVLGAAKIAVAKVIPAMAGCGLAEVTAIASRDAAKARKAADALNVPKAYGSYEELLADPDIDVVYNPLPNHLHVPLTIAALRAGKHVLCEKPIACTAVEARALLQEAADHPRLKVMEAFMYRFHPQWTTAKKLATKGRIGRLVTIQTSFSYYNVDPANVRNDPTIGGGGLLDIGCYAVSLARWIFGREPRFVAASIEEDPEF
ncbi:MAG: Gfo/Idh/MocA family protein, partial [Planctomycetia bacterium]